MEKLKTRGLKDLYLPTKLAFHVKIILFVALFSFLFCLYILRKPDAHFIIFTFLVAVTEMEIVIWFYNRLKSSKKAIEYSKKVKTPIDLTKQTLLGYLIFLVFFNIVAFLCFTAFLFLLYLVKGGDFQYMIRHSYSTEILGMFKAVNIALLFTIPITLYGQWQKAIKREFKLREENLIFQNQTLRNQVNPHFLFNSLNTLSSLVNTQAEIADLFINKLSSIYRYILENAQKERIILQEELEFIKDYFYLQKIRNQDKVELRIEVINAQDYEIIPVSLQLLVENAVKHNMATNEKPLTISISIEDDYIVVKNNLQKMASTSYSPGMGLQNLKERTRLSLERELIIETINQQFVVKVPIVKCK